MDLLNLGKCQQYIEFSYRAEPQLMMMRRSYKKLTGVMGEFGGVLKIFSSVIFFVYSIYSSWAIKKFFRRSLVESSQTGSQLGGQTVEEYIKNLGKIKNSKTVKAKVISGVVKKSKDDSKNLSKEMGEAMTDLIKSRLNAVKILRLFNVLEALQEAFFSEEESELLPLALLNLRRKRLKAGKGSSKALTQPKQKAPDRSYQIPREQYGKKIEHQKMVVRQIGLADEEQGGVEKQNVGGVDHFKELYLKLKSKRVEERRSSQEDQINDQSEPLCSKFKDNPIQEFILTNLSDLFSDNEKDKEPPEKLQKLIKLRDCLESENQKDDHREKVKPKDSSFRFEDLDTPDPGSNLLEYSSMSPMRSSPFRMKRKKKKRNFISKKSLSESHDLNQDPKIPSKKVAELSKGKKKTIRKTSFGNRSQKKSINSLEFRLE